MNQDKLAEELPNLPGRLEDAIAAMLTAAQQRPDDHRFLASRALAADKNVSDTPPAVFHQALLSALESRLRNRPTQPLVLFGPSGAGKSWLAEHAARRADASCIMIRLGGATTAAELVGQVQLAVGDDAELLLGVKARVSADNAPILLASALSSLRRRLLALASLETDLRPVVIIDDACFRTAAAEASEEAAARRDSLLAQLGGWARHGFCHVIVTCIDPRFVTEARAGTALGRCASLCVCEMGDSEAVACMRAVYGARGITLDVEQARRVLDRVGRLPADLVSLWDDTLAATTAADVASHAEAESAPPPPLPRARACAAAALAWDWLAVLQLGPCNPAVERPGAACGVGGGAVGRQDSGAAGCGRADDRWGRHGARSAQIRQCVLRRATA